MKIKLSFIFTLLALVLVANLSAQNKIQFDESGYQSVLQRSKKEHKPIFYMLYATWCAHCNKMKSEVFTDTLVVNFINKNFIPAWQDAEKGEGDFFKKKFGIRFYPTFLFLNEDGKELYNTSGEFKSDTFVSEAKNALVKEKQLVYLEQEFLADVSNSDKCLAYLSALNKGRDRTLLSPIAQQYLATQSESQLVSNTNWKIIANGVTDIQSREFQYVLTHQAAFEAVASPKRVQRKIENIVTELLTLPVEFRDTIDYTKKRMIAETIHTRKNDSLLFDFDIRIAEKTMNWKKYKAITQKSTDEFALKDAKTLKDIASNYLKHIADTASLKYAIRWTQQALTLSDTYDIQILLAKLYQKNKDYKEALEWANKAKAKNESLGWKTKDADDLLVELSQKQTSK
ncbi:thioredoxin fold domain-containing protein [Flavobacterium sp.]|uniref:thioredoxin family protein n=1 Tax=Flavobacterium sp. TaxID=239 RepID=UPI00286B579E|nr:thioredoxin fold domain-containing protein [Flavobacterium sp.]